MITRDDITVRIIADLPQEQVKKLALFCRRKKTSRTEAVRRALDRFLRGFVPKRLAPLDRTKRRNVPSPRGTTRNAEREHSSAAVFPHAFGNVLQIRCGPVSVRPAHCLEQHFLKRLDAAAELARF